MTITETIAALEKIRAEHGDLFVQKILLNEDCEPCVRRYVQLGMRHGKRWFLLHDSDHHQGELVACL